jgi:hypothetical protein
MDLSRLKPVVYAPGPVASVHMDASRTDAEGEHEVELRWRAVERQLVDAGIDEQMRQRLADRLLAPTGVGGEVGHTVVLTEAGVLLDEILTRAPARDAAHFGPIAHLMPWVRLHADDARYAVVQVDHAGADIYCVDGSGLPHADERSEGGHDVLHKVPGGGWSHLRYQNRVEDSWERNGAQVAADLDSVVVRHDLDRVFLLGEAYSRSVVHQHASRRVGDRLIDLDHSGADETADEQIASVLAQDLLERQQKVIDEFQRRRGTGDQAVADGYAAVIEALRRSAVDTVLLLDRPESTFTLAAGDEPTQLGHRPEDATELGADHPFTDRADEIVLRALVALDAQLELLVTDDGLDLRDGIGATLRFDPGLS